MFNLKNKTTEELYSSLNKARKMKSNSKYYIIDCLHAELKGRI